jgi:predicted permease
MTNVFRGDRINRELDEEFSSHLEEAIASGRDPEEVRRAFGSALRQREKSREFRVAEGMENLRADVVFGWRQLMKRKVTTAAAVLSLGLAIGSCLAAYRLVDALFLRPMPVSHPEQLYLVAYAGLNGRGEFRKMDASSYPLFLEMRDAVKQDADLVDAEYSYRMDLTYGSYQQTEQATFGPVSGEFFEKMGMQPAMGRLIVADDDVMGAPRAVAVLSYAYWKKRFNGDAQVVGHTFRMSDVLYQIVGIAPKGYTGTEPGTMADVFMPALMDPSARERSAFDQYIFLRPARGANLETLRSKLDAVFHHYEHERSKGWTDLPKYLSEGWPHSNVFLKPAAVGVSGMQEGYRTALLALGVLVGMVLLIACANVANLMQAQAVGRVREMAVRVALGAGRARLVRLVILESVLLSLMAGVAGVLFAWWAAPFVVARMSDPQRPIQLVLQADWSVVLFGIALTLLVTVLFGLYPAIRASRVMPSRALKGGDEPKAQRAKMHVLIAAQVAFCLVVLFLAGLFTMTFRKLTQKPIGFEAGSLLTLSMTAEQPVPQARWNELMERMHQVPGVKLVGMARWGLMGGNSENNFIRVPGRPRIDVLSYFLYVSPAWRAAMDVPLLEGRDLRESDLQDDVALVNKTFVQTFFHDENPLGKSISIGYPKPLTIVGVVGDAVYKDLREKTLPQVYQPLRAVGKDGALKDVRSGSVFVRTESARPAFLTESLRKVVAGDASFRIQSVRAQSEIVSSQLMRERMLATLAAFFAAIALLLASIGLYGVLSYNVLQREKELGIRIAIGARIGSVAQLVISRVLVMVLLGEALGIAMGSMASKAVTSLLFDVKGNDFAAFVLPTLVLLVVALLAALPAVVRAMRINPVVMLRAE